MTKHIPKRYLDLMIRGICPNCEIQMILDDGTKSHSNQQLDRCQAEFRKKIDFPRQINTFNFKGKKYVVDGHYEPRKKN